MRSSIVGVLAALCCALLVAPPPASAARTVESHRVVFRVENTNATPAVCVPDDGSYRLSGRLVGPTRVLDGVAGATRVNVLVHDLATGSWFWNLRRHPAYDYATRLAKRGETTLVLDRLGYGRSRLADGDATCLGAQADMLHQVVQDLRSGMYRYARPADGSAPAAAEVVTHGHSVGAAIAQVEAATFDDVDGLVLMSWTDRGATTLATRTAARQNAACLTGGDYAPIADTATEYRALLFASAPRSVQRAAAGLRDPDPCGDVTSLTTMLLASNHAAGRVDAPILLLYGSKDALNRPQARRDQAASYPTRVTTRTFRGAGSALPLERPAAGVRRAVLRWLDRV